MTSKATVWMEGLGQLKNPMTPSGIKPTTFWLAAQCLNHLHCSAPYQIFMDKTVSFSRWYYVSYSQDIKEYAKGIFQAG
jgi:hypothetical protein